MQFDLANYPAQIEWNGLILNVISKTFVRFRSTKDFKLELSDDPLYVHGGMSWTTAVTGTLDSIYTEACENGCFGILALGICGGALCCGSIPTQVFPFGEVQTARSAFKKKHDTKTSQQQLAFFILSSDMPGSLPTHTMALKGLD